MQRCRLWGSSGTCPQLLKNAYGFHWLLPLDPNILIPLPNIFYNLRQCTHGYLWAGIKDCSSASNSFHSLQLFSRPKAKQTRLFQRPTNADAHTHGTSERQYQCHFDSFDAVASNRGRLCPLHFETVYTVPFMTCFGWRQTFRLRDENSWHSHGLVGCATHLKSLLTPNVNSSHNKIIFNGSNDVTGVREVAG